jgi:hypothetical protein
MPASVFVYSANSLFPDTAATLCTTTRQIDRTDNSFFPAIAEASPFDSMAVIWNTLKQG